MSIRGKSAIVGAAESELGKVGPGFTPLDLVGQATERALADAGLDKKDVDGLFSASVYYQLPTLSAGEYLVHLQERFWAMNYSAAYELAERTTTSLVNAHKASLSIAQNVS